MPSRREAKILGNKEHPANKSYTQEEFRKIAEELGWTVSKARGKGSHYFASKEGEKGFPIPQKLKKGLQESIKKRLGLK